MSYFTKKNIKNWKWWVGLIIMAVTVTVLSPLILLGVIIDILDYIFEIIHRKLDSSISGAWRKLGRWIKK